MSEADETKNRDEAKDRDPGERGQDSEGSFLSRWSRRKVAARTGEPLPEPEVSGAVPPGASVPVTEAPVELPSIDSLKGLESDYGDFLRPGVDESTRRAAMKKLFADPHFNKIDGLDVYIDDYGIPDPIPEAMMKTLEHAKALLRPAEPPAEPVISGTAAGSSGAGASPASAPPSVQGATGPSTSSADAASHQSREERSASDEDAGPASTPPAAT